MGLWIHNGSEHLDAISDYRTILGVCIALPILMVIVVAMRAYTRVKILNSLGFDDWVIFFSAICAIIYAGLCIGQSRWGLGLPIKQRPKPNLNDYSVINFAGRPFYMIGILGFKVALCWAYLRILKASPNPHYKILIFIVMVGAILGHVAGTLVLIFQCSPIRKSWVPLTKGKCLANDATFYGLAAVTIFFDVIIFFLPIPLLLKLNINLKKKIALCGVFLLGLLTTVCSVMRMVQIIAIARSGNSTMLVLWGVIEVNVGIILTCIPTLGPLFPSLTGGTSNTISQNHHHIKLGVYRGKGIDAGGGIGGGPQGPIAFRSDHLGGTTAHASDSSSQEEILGLKSVEAAAYGIRDDDILKTTDIRVSVDEGERGVSRAHSARAW
ncbi:MAG: hypothetical protein LQ352_007180 [Teloschistes flavicans]|nr:MAG: hypothetical protein LQ352_007180 [Teloschistes flavicans]